MPDARDLAQSECEQLVRAGVVGRVAVATPTGPHIVPINYSVVDSAIVVRTTPYSVLGTYARNALLAFEIDQFDHDRHRGWSVVVRGRAESVDDAEEVEHIQRTWAPRPWASGQRWLFLRIPMSEVSGRRLGGGWEARELLPVNRVV